MRYPWKRPTQCRAFCVLGLVVCTSCQPHASLTNQHRPTTASALTATAPIETHPTTTTRPTAEAEQPAEVDRLIALYPELRHQWLMYCSKEGDAHRSDEFAQLALLLDLTTFTGRGHMTRTHPASRATQTEVYSFLGLPDCVGTVGNRGLYVYSYWRTDTKSRWVIMVDIKDGMLDSVGLNDASVNDFSKYPKCRSWSDVLKSAQSRPAQRD